MRSKSFETHEMVEIGLKEAEESRRFLILWMRTIKNVLPMEGKECKQRKIEDV